jgi:endonuclease/exonuclease/phosphatase family metal-dependent hydrolase
MVYNKEELNNEINKLDNNLKKKFVINEFTNTKVKSNFIKFINNKDIKKLNNLLNKKGINDKNLFDLGKNSLKDGFELLILNNINIYRTYYGFVNKENEDNYYKKNPDKLVYLANKYFCFFIAREMWGGISSYKISKKIILLDFFNINNIENIIKLSYNKINDKIERDKFIYYLKIFTGYNVSFKDQISNIQPYIKYIKIYDKPYIEDYTYHYSNCINNNIKGLNPFTFIYNNTDIKHYVFDVLFKYILNNMNIDGIICKSILSNFYFNGIYEQEEIILKPSSFINNLKFDNNDEICWTKYNLINNLRFDNILLKMNLFRSISYYQQKKIHPNDNFKLFSFYKEHEFKYNKIDNKKYILSYNLHSFNNLSEYVDRKTNINNILNFIKFYINNIEICFFQEIYFMDNKEHNNFILEMNNLGFKYYYYTINGGNNLYLYCFTKKKCNYNIIKDKFILTNNIKSIVNKIEEYPLYKNINTVRNYILLYYNNLKICNLHLNIGYGLKRDNVKLNNYIKKFNSILRIDELKKIIVHKPDIIMGDFNFEKDSDENKYLNDNNYNLLNNDNENSTPYNRCDHIYYYKKLNINNNTSINSSNSIKYLNNFLINCNYSDHLPLFQEINF